MPAQTSYSRYFSGLFAGQVSDTGPTYKRSLVNAAAIALQPGVGVFAKTDGISCNTLALTTDKVAGIVLNDFARDPDNLVGSADAVKIGASAPILVEGAVTVQVDQTVAVGDPVFVRFAAGAGGGALGSFRKDADTATARACKGARFLTGAAAGGVAEIYFSASVDAGT